MTPHPECHALRRSTPILRWILQRDANAITCELDARDDRSYELCVVPHWNPAAAMIERFDAPMAALLRQAEVASRLRENGWLVIDHVGGMRAAA